MNLRFVFLIESKHYYTGPIVGVYLLTVAQMETKTPQASVNQLHVNDLCFMNSKNKQCHIRSLKTEVDTKYLEEKKKKKKKIQPTS